MFETTTDILITNQMRNILNQTLLVKAKLQMIKTLKRKKLDQKLDQDLKIDLNRSIETQTLTIKPKVRDHMIQLLNIMITINQTIK